jgi:hypothetical protein
MEHLKTITMLLAFLLAAVLGCGGGSSSSSDADDEQTYNPVIIPQDFVADITNPYFPLTPGSVYVYEGETDEGSERVVVTVTHDIKEILGVACTVVRDQVWIDGELAEDTFDWFAQDKDGNVWYFGEDSMEIENGQVVGTEGSWEAGVDGAKPGVVMQGDPQIGQAYRQEYYAGEAEDMAKVLSVNESVIGPTGSYTKVLKTEEWSPLEPGIAEHKYYAPGVGLVLETVVTGGEGQLELVERSTAGE